MSKESLQEFPIKHEQYILKSHWINFTGESEKWDPYRQVHVTSMSPQSSPQDLHWTTLKHVSYLLFFYCWQQQCSCELYSSWTIDHSRQDLKAETDGERRSRRESRTCPEVGSLPKYFTWISSPGLNPSSLASSTCSVDKM